MRRLEDRQLPQPGRDASGLTESGVPRRSTDTVVSLFDPIVASRAAVLVLFGSLSWFGSAESGRTTAAVLILLALTQPLIAAVRARPATTRGVFLAHDLMAALLLVVVEPTYFWPASIALVSLMAIQAVASPVSGYVPIAVAVPIVLAIAGGLSGVAYFERAAGLAVILAVAHGFIGREVRQSAEATRRDLQFAIKAAGGLTHVTRLGDGLVEISDDVEHVVGWPRREWMTMDQSRVVHPDDADGFSVDANDVVHGQVIDRTGRVRTKDGRWIWLHDVSRVVNAGDHMELHGFTMDVTAHQIGLDRATAEATTDPLTGLANRRALITELADLADTAVHHLTLIDLNRFKEVNDTLGHEAGDVLLRVVADRIVASLSDGEFLARLGGDEFAIIHRGDVATEVVVANIETLGLELMRPVEISGVNVSTSISAGVVRALPGHSDRSTMMRHADMAMYTAKRERLIAVVFDDQMGSQLEQRLTLSAQVAGALRTGEIVLHFQPIVDARTGEITGAEGLARWEHPRLGLLSPVVFLDLILLSERSGDFTRCMVEQAISAAAHFASSGHSIPVSVNVPVRSVEDTDFEQWFVEACQAASVSPDQIVFEVAERDLHHAVATVAAIDRLSAIGVGIAVDDFGTGHATFDRLRWRNVSQIKLDRDIIRDAATDQRDRIIVRAIIDLAHSLGYAVVAEGVENIEQLEVLRSMGCEHIQGYLFSRPVPIGEFDDLLSRRTIGPYAASPVLVV